MMGPIRWPVAVIHCPHGALGCQPPLPTAVPFFDSPAEPEKDMSSVVDLLHYGDTLEPARKAQLAEELPNVWALSIADLGRTNLTTHRIDSGDTPPVAKKPTATPPTRTFLSTTPSRRCVSMAS
jgi:hypothetical protein